MKKKTTMAQKAIRYKIAAYAAGIMLPGTGLSTIFHDIAQIYRDADAYWNPDHVAWVAAIVAPYGDADMMAEDSKESTNKNNDNATPINPDSKEGES